MEEKKTSKLGAIFEDVFGQQVDAAKFGLGVSASVEFEELLVDTFHEVRPVKVPRWAQASWVREYLEPLLLSSSLMIACKLWPDRVPKRIVLERMSYLASVGKWNELSRPAMRFARKFGTILVKKLKDSSLSEMLDQIEG